jgi:hypothetical protein
MNIAEILRGLADKMDSISGSKVPHQDQSAQLHQVEPSNDENPEVNTMPQVGPLQQKLELLKKAAGVESAYDDGNILQGHDHEEGCTDCGCDPCACGGEEDELSAMKRNAGLPVVVQLTSTDNDIEG